jgi:hypothetical protein
METPRAYRVRERPLAAEDYDVPVGWWGWNWDPPVPMSVIQILAARNLDARTTALCWMVLEAHGSMLIAAEPPHSGKTTTLTAFLDFLPNDVRRVFLRGWAETFDYVRHGDPRRTLLLANELSSHLPVYLWGPKAVEAFRTLRKGYAIASTLHADSPEDALTQLVGELGVSAEDLTRIDLLLVMRMYRLGGTARVDGPVAGPVARRVVSVHRPVPGPRGIALEALVEWDQATDTHRHDETAELELLCQRRGGPLDGLRDELDRREAFLRSLQDRGVVAIRGVREAIARYRGETAPRAVRGDPTA